MRYPEKRGQEHGNIGLSRAASHHFEKWSFKVLRHPRVNIVLPLLIVILLSYSTVSNFRCSSPRYNYISRVQLRDEKAQMDSLAYDEELTIFQIWVESISADNNILGKRALLECLAFQNKLLKGISNTTAMISPFQIWGHSLEELQKDYSPLRTINSKRVTMPQYSFFKTWKVNGYITSAAGFIITVLSKSREASNVFQELSNNMDYLNSISNVTSFQVLLPEHSPRIATTEFPEKFDLSYKIIGKQWNFLLVLLYALLIIYIIEMTRRFKFAVKSLTGIAIAMFAEIILAITSSVTITNLVFKGSHDNFPIRLFCLPVILILSNLQLHTLHTISQYRGEGTALSDERSTDASEKYKRSKTRSRAPIESFISRLSSCHFQAIKVSVLFSIIVIFLVPFSRTVTHFILVSLFVGHFLHFTFFAAVVSLDFRRLDGSDIAEGLSNDVRLDDEFPDRSTRRSYITLASGKMIVLLSLAYLVLCNHIFSPARPSSSILYKLINSGWYPIMNFRKPISKAVFDEKFIADYLLATLPRAHSNSFITALSVENPVLALKFNNKVPSEDMLQSSFESLFVTPSSTSSYRVDLYYALQVLVFIVLALSCTLLLLQKLMEKLDLARTIGVLEGDSALKDGIPGRSDAKKNEEVPGLCDHSTQTEVPTTDHFHMKELYMGGHNLDITMIATSKAPFAVSVGLDHTVYVWSPLVNPIPKPTKIPLPRKFWPLSKITLSNDGNYIAFFSESGYITTWSRQHMKFIWELKLKRSSCGQNKAAYPLEALFRKITFPSFKSKRLQSLAKTEANGRRASVASSEFVPIVTGGLDASYEKFGSVPKDTDNENELVFVTSAGHIYTVNDNGCINVEELTPSVHELKSCKLLSSPRVNDRLVICDEIGDLYIATVVNNKWRTRKLQPNYSRILKPPPSSCEFKNNANSSNTFDLAPTSLSTDHTIELVSFVGLIVRVVGKTADLLDAQTGTVIRSFAIGRFKSNTLRVFHDSPVHCKFCGSASVASFSIAYSDQHLDRVTMHTYKLESKTKTSICLRVERDVREIRCLGMESAIDTVQYVYDVEDWCVTDNNMLIGMRKVPQNIGTEKVGSSSFSVGSPNDAYGSSISKRKKKNIAGLEYDDDSLSLIHNIWEGWTMTATGKFSLHKIPVGVNGLLVDRLGPLAKFGAKAVIVGFANIMNMFYVGHEELIFSTETDDANKEETGLRFVNKRRDRFSHRKQPLDYNSL